jgi:hypothetical protein
MGTVTLFMDMAVGLMDSNLAGSSSRGVNLSDVHEYSLVFINPPSQETLKSYEQANVFAQQGVARD